MQAERRAGLDRRQIRIIHEGYKVKISFKNISHRVHRVFKVSVSPNRWTTECTENISGTSPWSLCVVSVTSVRNSLPLSSPPGKSCIVRGKQEDR